MTRSKGAAVNVQDQATLFLERELKLTVNRHKTHIVHSDNGVKFLGVVIHTKYTRIQEDKIRRFKEKVRGITRRNSPVNVEKVIEDLNPHPTSISGGLGLYDLASVRTGISVSVS